MSNRNGHANGLEPLGATTMSNRLFVCLNEAAKRGGLTLDRMLGMSQTTVGNVIRRGYLQWNNVSASFAITPLGLQVREQFDKTDIDRVSMYRPLSSLIKDRHVHQLVEHTREVLKADFMQLKRKEKERESDKVKRQRVKMKTIPIKAAAKAGRSAA